MEHFSNEFCQIALYDQFAILTLNENINLTLEKASIIRNKLREHFKSKDFLMINYRKHKNEISTEVYERGQLSNMKGLAIVSDDNEERNKAFTEQHLYDKSFVFFSTIEEAKSWAENYF